jgi:hypothetical protein
MLPHARACLVPVVIMVSSEMGKDLAFLLFPSVDVRGGPESKPEWKLVMLSSRSGWLIWA